MGADITWCVERHDGARWHRAEERVHDPHPLLPSGHVQWYSLRDYWLFRLLAGKNAWVNAPNERGLPSDVSAGTQTDLEAADGVWHPHHLTLMELLGVAWRTPVPVQFYVDDRFYDGSRGRAKHVLDQLDRAARRGLPPAAAVPRFQLPPNSIDQPMGEVGTFVTLERPVIEQVSEDFLRCLVAMATAAKGELSSVRAVFWYDQQVPAIDLVDDAPLEGAL